MSTTTKPHIVSPEMLAKIATLSTMEMTTFRELGSGKSTRSIADTNGCRRSVKTVETQMAQCQRKLDVDGSNALRCIAVRFQVYCEQNDITPRFATPEQRRRQNFVFDNAESKTVGI